ncbi:hypothetical protein HDU96_002259 [Phlyctochytrium bullatum]|nr:hypothetical protein HDU96_002259 [Phlyctochytrium bullatum]
MPVIAANLSLGIPSFLLRLLNLLAFVGVVYYNYHSSAAFDEGKNKPVGLDLFSANSTRPSPSSGVWIVPARYAFSIWGVIYSLVLSFLVFQLVPSTFVADPAVGAAWTRNAETVIVERVGVLFIVSCFFNTLWLYVFSSGYHLLSFFVILGLLGSVGAIFFLVHPVTRGLPYGVLTLDASDVNSAGDEAAPLISGVDASKRADGWGVKAFVALPFSMYFGWLVCASTVNFFSVFLPIDPNNPSSTLPVSLVALTALGVFSLFVLSYFQDLTVALVAVWALSSIPHNGAIAKYPGERAGVWVAWTAGVVAAVVGFACGVLAVLRVAALTRKAISRILIPHTPSTMNHFTEVVVDEAVRRKDKENQGQQPSSSSSSSSETTPLLKHRSSGRLDDVDEVPNSVVKFPDFQDNGRHHNYDGVSIGGYDEPEWITQLRDLMTNTPATPQGTMINLVFTIVLIVSIILLCLGTEPSVIENHSSALLLFWLNLLSIIVFTVEFSIDCLIYRGPWVCLMFEPTFIIDFLAIFPFYLEIIISILSGSSVVSGATAVEGFAALRVLRLLRVVRIFKVFERSPKLRILSLALSKSIDGIIILVLVAPLLVCFFGTLSFYAEQTDEYYKDGVWYYTNGDKSPFQSITACFWLTIVTLTTVGYGDVTPRTSLGRWVSALASLTALVFLAFPLTVITTQYTNVLNDEMDKEREAEAEARREAEASAAVAQVNRGRSLEKSPLLSSPATTSHLSPSPSRKDTASYFSQKTAPAKLLELNRNEEVVTLRLAVQGEEGYRRLLQILAEATSAGTP